MNDYALLEISAQKRADAQRERARDRLANLAHCCHPSRIAQWIAALRAGHHALACSSPSCA